MRIRILNLAVAVGILLTPAVSAYAWTSVGTGIEYQYFSASGPNNVYVARMLRSETAATIDTTIANGTISGARQTTKNQAALYDDSLTWWGGSWGKRNDVAVAINGGLFNATTGIIDGGQVQSGWYSHWFVDMGGFSGFGWRNDRTPFIGQCVDHSASTVYVRWQPSGSTLGIDGINESSPLSGRLYVYTPQYNTQTPTGSRTEVLVEMTQPNLTTSGSGYSVGYIREIRQNSGSTLIPFDYVILTADGSTGTALANNSSIGGEVRICQELTDRNQPTTSGTNACQTLTGTNWGNTFSAINVNYHFLENGVIRSPDPSYHGYAGMIVRNPRTCICYNADYVFFVVCDGRSGVSVGWTSDEMATFCKNTLGATDGVNLDGGGSSTMVVNGVVQNDPSDGTERTVCNGVMMVNLAPKLQSAVFNAGQTVTVASPANLRLGPGTNYGTITSQAAGSTGTVQSHSLSGIYAKGYYWWKVSFSGTTGWVAESLLVMPSTAPTITLQPVAQTVLAGSAATFTLGASGPGTLSYQWQKNSTNLSNGGHYSGVTTATLTVSSCDSGDVANYRCVVSNAYGTATSNAASLALGTAPPAPAAQASTNIGTETITWNWGSSATATGYRLWTAASGGTQIGGTITGLSYAESGLYPGTSYTRYVEAFNGPGSSARTQLPATNTSLRNCPQNGDFESGFNGGIGNYWTKGPGTGAFYQETGIKRDGTSSQKIVDESGGDAFTAWLYQRLNVQPNRGYTAKVYTRREVTNGCVSQVGIDLTGGTAPTILYNCVGNAGEWRLKTFSFTSGTSNLITVLMNAGYNGGDTTAYIDGVYLNPRAPVTTGGTATVCAGAAVTLTATGGYGGSDSELHWYTGQTGTGTHVGTGTSLIVNPTATTTYYPRWEASGCSGCCTSDDGSAVTITVYPPPTAVAITDEGTYTPSLDTLKANWTPSTSGCGINRYECAVGTSSNTQDIKSWTSSGTSTSAVISGLSLVEGVTYYVQARAVDNGGNPSAGASANGIMAAPGMSRISDAWPKPNTTYALSLRSKTVTYSSTSEFYLEESDGSSGIRVVSSANPGTGSLTSVAGVLALAGPQRVLSGDVVLATAGNNAVPIVALTSRYLGGASFNGLTPGVTNGIGLYNIGLLVRVCGKVDFADNATDINNKYCYIDDGSGLTSAGHKGVKVRCGAVNAPTSGYATMTGVVSTESVGSVVVPVIVIRDGTDICAF